METVLVVAEHSRFDEIKKLFVEPVLQGSGIGEKLLNHAVESRGAAWLWALEKNERAIKFYRKHGFRLTDEKKLEDGTEAAVTDDVITGILGGEQVSEPVT